VDVPLVLVKLSKSLSNSNTIPIQRKVFFRKGGHLYLPKRNTGFSIYGHSSMVE
jgi:hypothetical protein